MTTKEFDEGDKFRRFEADLDDPSEVLETVGLLLVSTFQLSFKAQRFGKHKWKQRGPINTFGIIADFASGAKQPKKRRFDRKPVLMDTGHAGGLVSTISHRVMGNMVEVGANKDYADVHQTGGTVYSKPITPTVRESLYAWLKKKAGQEYKKKLGWILNDKFKGEKIEGEVPARPYIGMTKKLMKDIKDQVGVKIMEIK